MVDFFVRIQKNHLIAIMISLKKMPKLNSNFNRKL